MIVRVIDAHASGAPCRVVVGGLEALELQGATMFAKKQHMAGHHDWLRQGLVTEPRGFPATNVDFVLAPCDPSADVGLIIGAQGGCYPPMSGGNIICTVTALLEGGVLPWASTVTVDTPGGLVIARVVSADGKVTEVAFANVPSFVTHVDEPLRVPGLGDCRVDIAYGGMFYVIVDAVAFGLTLDADHGAELVAVGQRVRRAARERFDVVHPTNPSIRGVDQVVLRGPARAAENHGRNAVVMSQGLVDRCPCGTGTSALLAVFHARGELAAGDDFRHESVLDGVFVGSIFETTDVGGVPAVIPEIRGRAWITAVGDVVLDDDDPLRSGFTIGDLWPG